MKPLCANPLCPRVAAGGVRFPWRSPSGVRDNDRWFCSEGCRIQVLGQEAVAAYRSGERRTLRRLKLGLLLLKDNLIERDKLMVALERQAASGQRLGEVLIDAGYITSRDLNAALARQAGIAPIALEPRTPVKLTERIPADLACAMEFVVFGADPDRHTISVAVADIDTIPYLNDFFARAFPGHFVTFFLEERERVREILAAHWPDHAAFAPEAEGETAGESAEDLPLRCADFLQGLGIEPVILDHQTGKVVVGGRVGKVRIDIVLTPVE